MKAATKAPTNPNAPSVRVGTVENPYYMQDHGDESPTARYIQAPINMRESPITWMLAHDKVDQAQAKAATRFRQLHEMSGGGDLQAMDYMKEPVDGGGFPEIITDRKAQAAKELGEVRTVLGVAGYTLVMQVCGQCIWLKDIEPTKRRQVEAGKALRQCLTVLAEHWGYRSQPIRAWRKAG